MTRATHPAAGHSPNSALPNAILATAHPSKAALLKTTPLKTTVFALLVLASLGFAQDAPTRVVFVDTQAAIAAHPAGEAAAGLQEQARVEIEALNADLQGLIDRINGGQQLSQEEQARFQQLRTAVVAVQERYATQIQEVVAPALEAVNEVIRQIAEENGYDMVLDSVVAGPEPRGINLVVFARTQLDITPLVIERVRALEP